MVSVKARERQWIEIFKDRSTEQLKEILQEGMDWTTSLPILERLDRLYDLEKRRAAGAGATRHEIRKPGSNK